MNYHLFYSTQHSTAQGADFPAYDLFLTGFDHCYRTKTTYTEINSTKKVWLIFPQYELNAIDYSNQGEVYISGSFEEDEYFAQLLSNYPVTNTTKICIDISGIMRPHLIYLIKLLYRQGIKSIDFLYSEPTHYEHAEDTAFTGIAGAVEPIRGFSPDDNNPRSDNDLLIICTGYDDQLTQKVLQEKIRVPNKYHIIGFPSLQLDMYQESMLKLTQTKDLIENNSYTEYAPAMDPFTTAQIIQGIVDKYENATNIYLCPISTKPHTLGVALYYMVNYANKPVSIIYPYSRKYHTGTAKGRKRIWKYTFELP